MKRKRKFKSFLYHFAQERAAVKKARILSKRFECEICAFLKPDEEGRWHVIAVREYGGEYSNSEYEIHISNF